MLNPSDKELDRLSREAAEHYEPDEQILSWEQLVPRLDREIGAKPNTGFRIFGRGSVGFAVGVIALVGVSLFVLKQRKSSLTGVTPKTEISTSPVNKTPEEDKSAGQSSTNSNEKLNSDKKDEGGPKTTSGDAVKNENSTSSGQASSDKAVNEKNTGSADKSSNKLSTETNPSGIPLANEGGNKASSSKRSGITKDQQKAVGIAAVITASNANEQLINNKRTNKNGTTSAGDKASQDFSGAGSAAQEDIKMVDLGLASPALQKGPISTEFTLKTHSNLELSSAAIDQSKNTQRALRMNRALKIGVLYGSDVTSVHSVAPDRLSQGWGLTIGYQFHDHWSINTGVIYTQKNYSANGKDFHVNTSSWLPQYKLDYVDGNCNMWEIPLTVRYDFDRINNTTLFINAGASSYLMTHESYMYYGHTYYSGSIVNVQSPSPIPYDTKENYLFSVIDFSLGVEQKLNKSLSFQVEPYIKIPVQGVGKGAVDLSSYGVNLSLRFAPSLKASRK